MMSTETYQSFEIGSAEKLSGKQKQSLVHEFQRPPEAARGCLSGRIRPCNIFIEGIGQVVVKHYFRGGILGNLNRRTYLKIGKTRSAAEFETLVHVRSIGVSAPEPVAFAFRKKRPVFYHAWLVTKEIQASETLADLSRTDPARAEAILKKAGEQVKRLIENGVMHVDLHPGNVLVDGNSCVYVIDFDRAKTGIKNRQNLAGLYLSRWRRAVVKHGLPEFMANLDPDSDGMSKC